MTVTPIPDYVFADGDTTDHHADLLDTLASTLDQFTAARLILAGAGLPGQRVLEVGAGSGSVAVQMANRMAGSGEVVATDIDTRPCAGHELVSIVTHNIATDPLEPQGTFDAIHARLVLGHLPNRREVLTKLADALNPGGVIVIEEMIPSWDRCVMATPDPAAYRLFENYHHALSTVLESAGVDTDWGRGVYAAMQRTGLVNVDAEMWARAWRGGEPGCMLPYLASAQLRPKLVEAGMTEADLDEFRVLLLNPRLVIYGNLAISTVGWMPA